MREPLADFACKPIARNPTTTKAIILKANRYHETQQRLTSGEKFSRYSKLNEAHTKFGKI